MTMTWMGYSECFFDEVGLLGRQNIGHKKTGIVPVFLFANARLIRSA